MKLNQLKAAIAKKPSAPSALASALGKKTPWKSVKV